MQEIVNIRDTMKALEPEAIKKPFAEVLHEVQEYISSTYASVLKDNPDDNRELILSQQLSFFYACLRDIDTGSPVTVSAKEKYILPLTAADIEKRGGTHGRIERKYLHAERCRLCPPIIFRRLIKFIIGRRKNCGVMSY